MTPVVSVQFLAEAHKLFTLTFYYICFGFLHLQRELLLPVKTCISLTEPHTHLFSCPITHSFLPSLLLSYRGGPDSLQQIPNKTFHSPLLFTTSSLSYLTHYITSPSYTNLEIIRCAFHLHCGLFLCVRLKCRGSSLCLSRRGTNGKCSILAMLAKTAPCTS